jgi:hypothetical protein
MVELKTKDVPKGYVVCTREDCAVCENCLRHIALKVMTKKEWMIRHVNPKRTQPSTLCEYFRSDRPQVFARGFANMKEEMLPRQYGVFMSRLTDRFGRTGYFERRRGEKLCSPEDIEFIRSVLEDIGMSHLDFDAFEEHYNWDE